MSIFDKFNKGLDLEGLKNDIKEVGQNNSSSDFKEVIAGQYEVEITKMELKASKKGDPMLSIWFKILEGEFKGSLIFYNQMLTTGFGIHNALQFIRSMELESSIGFDDFVQFGNLIETIFNDEINEKLDFILDYGVNNKGFNTFEIVEVFDKE